MQVKIQMNINNDESKQHLWRCDDFNFEKQSRRQLTNNLKLRYRLIIIFKIVENAKT